MNDDAQMREHYEAFAGAIVTQASKDYRAALKSLKKHPCNNAAKQTKRECERFFRSDWYKLLTKVDCDYLIWAIQMEVGYDG